MRDLVIECEGEADEDEEKVVRVIAGSVFVLEGEVEEAVATLNEGCAKTDLEWSVDVPESIQPIFVLKERLVLRFSCNFYSHWTVGTSPRALSNPPNK